MNVTQLISIPNSTNPSRDFSQVAPCGTRMRHQPGNVLWQQATPSEKEGETTRCEHRGHLRRSWDSLGFLWVPWGLGGHSSKAKPFGFYLGENEGPQRFHFHVVSDPY